MLALRKAIVHAHRIKVELPFGLAQYRRCRAKMASRRSTVCDEFHDLHNTERPVTAKASTDQQSALLYPM